MHTHAHSYKTGCNQLKLSCLSTGVQFSRLEIEMALDAAFDGVGRDPGIIIWRIEVSLITIIHKYNH